MKRLREYQQEIIAILWTIAALLAWLQDNLAYYIGWGFIGLALYSWVIIPELRNRKHSKSVSTPRYVLEPFKLRMKFDFPGRNGRIDQAAINVGELEFLKPPTQDMIKERIIKIIHNWLHMQITVDFKTEDLTSKELGLLDDTSRQNNKG
jgi:hypothetical protein